MIQKITIRRKAVAGWSDSYAWLCKLLLHTKLFVIINYQKKPFPSLHINNDKQANDIPAP